MVHTAAEKYLGVSGCHGIWSNTISALIRSSLTSQQLDNICPPNLKADFKLQNDCYLHIFWFEITRKSYIFWSCFLRIRFYFLQHCYNCYIREHRVRTNCLQKHMQSFPWKSSLPVFKTNPALMRILNLQAACTINCAGAVLKIRAMTDIWKM